MENLKKYFEILDLEPGAPPEEVERAYRDLLEVWNPDRFADGNKGLRKRAQEKLCKISEAYRTIRSYRPTILIVDDEADIREILSEALAKEPYRVLTAESAEEALKILEREPVDVIVSDEKMPGMPGSEFLSIACRKYPDTVRMILTGYATLDAAIKAINEGHIYRFFQKPCNMVDFMVTIRQALRQKELTRRSVLLEDYIKEQTLEINSKNRQLQKNNKKLRSNFRNTITAFSGLMELRDRVSTNHSRNVAGVAVKTAKLMGLSREDIETVAVASLLHDIGKIGIPDVLMVKNPDDMNPDELDIYKEHPVRGQAAIVPIEDLKGAGLLIRHHHEQYDGQGFPDGLAGENIPLGSRIIAIADFVDRMIGLYDADSAMRITLKMVRDGLDKKFDRKLYGFAEEAVADFYKENLPIMGAVEMELSSKDLQPGMVLSRDVRSGTGLLILSKGIKLDGISIQALKRYYQVDPSKTGVFVWAKR